ncbi:MAG: hypothetical protein HY753_09190 [Nitrospirae bacterium]|nr:hypothetical protein [Nitrospirota bacterium]
MTINHRCTYYKHEEIKRNRVRNTFDEDEPVVLHSCYHPQNTKAGRLIVTSKGCDVNNDFCPENPKLKNK